MFRITALFLVVIVVQTSLIVAARLEYRHHKSNVGCSKCIPDACPKSDAECEPHGPLVRDVCDCCEKGVCGLPEGAKCYNATATPALPHEHKKFGACGVSLVCLVRQDLAERDEPEALCVCKDEQEACGSDGRTYETVCQMSQEAIRSGSTLYLKHWGPCASVPWVISGPIDSAAILHHGLALDCEVKGYPIPAVHWEFVGDDGTRRTMPADDLYVAVQVRGGPEPYMVTSWLQIVDLRHSDTGTYTCVASNSEGASTASAKVGVRG